MAQGRQEALPVCLILNTVKKIMTLRVVRYLTTEAVLAITYDGVKRIAYPRRVF